jgi:hypothetical protein
MTSTQKQRNTVLVVSCTRETGHSTQLDYTRSLKTTLCWTSSTQTSMTMIMITEKKTKKMKKWRVKKMERMRPTRPTKLD